MTRTAARTRAAGATVALLAASVALHALLVSGLAGRLGTPAARPPSDPATVEVVIVTPPAAAAPALAAAPPLAQAPAAAPRRPPPRPKPAARAPAATAAITEPPAAPAVVADAAAAADAGEVAEVAASAAPPADPQVAPVPVPDAPADTAPPLASAEPATTPVAAPPAAALPALPGTRHQRFKVYWGEFTDAVSVARLEYRLVNDGDRYELRTAGEAEGLLSLVYSGTLTQSSTGRLGPAGLQPVRYAETRGKRPERAVAFDPDAGRLLPVGRDPVPLPAGTQDRLSVFYQIGLIVRAEPARFVAGIGFDLPVATLREVRTERFVVIGTEMLVVPGGPVHALHLSRPAPPGTDDPRIDLWLGYDFEMLPVRLRIEDAGRRVLDQVIDLGG
jgi:hypothetical protein